MNVATFTGLMAAWVEEDIKNRTICAIIGEKQGDVMRTAVFQHGSERAVHLYQYFNECLRKLDLEVEEGVFGAQMDINLTNAGPITVILDSEVLW